MFRSVCFAGLLCLLPLTVFAQTADVQPSPTMIPNSFADLAGRVQDAVVNISTTQKIVRPARGGGGMQGMPGMPPMPGMPDFPQGSPFQDFFEEFFNGPVGPNGGMIAPMPVQSLGSGFILDGEKGIIVTNNHVIDQAEEIQVILHDDTKLKATVLGRDKETDLALLKVTSPRKLVSVTWGDSDTMRVGDWVLAVGNPFGLGGTVTSGIISARQRNINAGRYDDFIQTDASINRGNSGGPMFNLNGEVIGINTAIFSPTGGSVGIGFAIPSNLAKPVIDQLMQYGTTRRGWIGVRIQNITPEIAESIGLEKDQGAMIASMTPDGPADKAGLKQGDVILKFDGKDINEMRFLPRIVADSPINKPAPITVFRPEAKGGKELTLSIIPGELEKAEQNGLLADEGAQPEVAEKKIKDTTISELKMDVAEISPSLRQQYKLGNDISGVIVTDVKRDSDAASKGILPGDVILEINQQAVKNAQEVKSALKTALSADKPSILLLVNSQNNLRFVAIKVAK